MKENMPWFRLYAEMVDDPKLRLLAFEDRWHYVALLCLKCQGILDKQADLKLMRRHVAVKLGVDTRTLDEIERRLVAEMLIEGDTLQPLQWDRRQFKSDSSAARTKEWRQRQKGEGGDPKTVPRHTYTPEFEQAWALYPDRPGRNKLETFKAWKARLANNHDPVTMIDGVKRYAAYCRAMKTEPRFIKSPVTFFGVHEHFMEQWRVPVAGLPGGGTKFEQRSAWAQEMTGNNGGSDDRSGEYIDVEAHRV